MAKHRKVAVAMRARAREVRQDASYGGIFEMLVWCNMRKVHLLLAYGITIMNVFNVCGHGLRPFKPKQTQNRGCEDD